MSRLLLFFILGMSCNTLSARTLVHEQLPAMPFAVSNNAVAVVESDSEIFVFSFLGLGEGKTYRDTQSEALVLTLGEESWEALQPVPGGEGRLAASAVGLGGAAWVFGGYTVDADGGETSIAGVYRIQAGEAQARWVTDMPVPVEDSVVLPYQDRYIYMISGWHDLGNVNLVQVLDTSTMQWQQATPWPGTPVFGHSGGIVNRDMLICDGVKVRYHENESPREFLPSNECWRGEIDTDNHRRIHWRKVMPHPGLPRYRMASGGNGENKVVFAGGSTNPYNFNGIGYNGVPAEPQAGVFSFDFESADWHLEGNLPIASMDHRGLPYADGWYYLSGGMNAQQKTTAAVMRFKLEP